MSRLHRQTNVLDGVIWAHSFNRELDRGAQYRLLEEEWLAARVSELEAIGHPTQDSYWLTLARIAELSLFCAGNYADSGMLREVGDLMFNPRTIMAHIRGQAAPVKKKRHEAMTAQFRDWAGEEDIISWLKRNTMNEIREKPIVPTLMEALSSCGRMTDDYLESLEARACKIADAVRLVSICLNGPVESFEQYLQMIGDRKRRSIESGLCRFDLAAFRNWEARYTPLPYNSNTKAL